MAHHRRDEHLSERRDIPKRHAGDPGEHHAREHVHLRQTAAHAPNQHVAENEQAIGKFRPVHDLSGQKEERDRHDHENIDPVHHLLGQHAQEQRVSGKKEVDRRGDKRDERNRHAERDQEQEESDKL